MEKRTIVAFALSFLVLIAWAFLFQPASKQEPAKVEEGAKIQSAPAGSAAPPEAAPGRPGPSEQPAQRPVIAPPTADQEKEILVETPLYKAVFSNVGPSIKSFQLKKYRLTTDPDSPLVELVHLENTGEGVFEATFENPAKPRTQKVFYHVEEQSLRLDEGSSPRDLVFSALTPEGLTIKQTFRIHPDKYPIDLTLDLTNTSANRADGRFAAHIKNTPPAKSQSYYAFLGIALLLDGDLEEIATKKMNKSEPLSGRIGWMAYEDGHFMSAVIPEGQEKGQVTARILPSGIVRGSYFTPALSLNDQERISSRYTLYMGPRDLSVLKSLDRELDRALNFGWTDVIAKPLLYALRFFYKYVGNYGLSIIILTILIKILFWPLTHKSYKSMKEMQKLQPYMAKLREKYKDNKEQLNKELMSLYKTYKVNPVGGCLPMVIQIPVFFALFRILGNSIELRHAPFILWINDLSAPDRLFSFSFKIPFMSPPYGIPILTLLMGASMLIQQKMTPTPGDPTQAKIMMFLPVVFTVMFINFPSGLVLYWLVNNILSIGQQYRIIKSSA